MNFDLSILQCPVTKHDLSEIKKEDFERLGLTEDFKGLGKINSGLIDSSQSYFYPIVDDIIVLHANYALYIGKDKDIRDKMSYDKKRVFDYYNEINYKTQNAMSIYEDSAKWVDYREVSKEYIQNSFTKAAKFYPPSGKYFLDIASGPIGLQEYLNLSRGYEYRICIDISINALIQAKHNFQHSAEKGIFICGDITNIPIKSNICNTVLSQHTLYHLPKKDQKTAVEELYRVALDGGGHVVIIYSWFWHGWFMNIALNVVQLYRIARHLAGKLYVKLNPKTKPRLYFHAHSPSWFKRSFSFSDKIEFYCWRSTDIYFMNMYIHKGLGGKKILRLLRKLEDKYSRFFGTFGEYPAIVIKK
ncbi:methyltransferase domain-containing protein [Cytophagaceae bacterium ABcell3]|nr:methyltransferase domain-containing protein [Cytophagaceae bacterium ABcell3]